jgi:NAD(P)H-dependent flavin oxidoreductase YrpB (nitropropane dioxygenase family)
MSNRVTSLLDCTYPVIEGGLAYVGNGLLAAEVSNGGGFGQVGAGGRSAEGFATELQVAVAHSTKAFGVNLPISEHRDPQPILDVIRAYREHIHAVSLSAGNPIPLIQPLRELGFVVLTLASTPRQAMKAERAGAHAVICEGTEAGGHDGPAELTTMALVPAVKRAVSIPVIAAGGIVNGETAAAAFCLGAEGIQMGTRFVATVECEAHVNYKEAVIQAGGEDTRVMERSLGRITRVLNSPFVERVLQQETDTPGDLEVLLPLISGRNNEVAAIQGQLDQGWLNCGQNVGLIKQILPAGQVVREVYEEAVQVLESRLRRLE